MIFLHTIIAVLASWRLAELFFMDRVTAKLREKYPSYVWTCSRCLSVWAAMFTTLPLIAYHFAWWTPYLNWPWALSWLYMVHKDWIVEKSRQTIRVELTPSGFVNVQTQLNADQAFAVFMRLVEDMAKAKAQASRPPAAIQTEQTAMSAPN